jgi:hypothetical protein
VTLRRASSVVVGVVPKPKSLPFESHFHQNALQTPLSSR